MQTRRYLRVLRDTAEGLLNFPERHSLLPIQTPGIRKARSGSHILLFRVAKDMIEIIRVLHERQDVPDEFEDLS